MFRSNMRMHYICTKSIFNSKDRIKILRKEKRLNKD
jgi:hypothetical protein